MRATHSTITPGTAQARAQFALQKHLRLRDQSRGVYGYTR